MDYCRYINNVFGSQQLDKLYLEKSVIVPFCIPHCELLNESPFRTELQKLRFNKWYKLPRKAHKLYWKFHRYPY